MLFICNYLSRNMHLFLWKQWQTFSWTETSLQMVTAALKLKDVCSLEESYDKPRQCIQKQRHHFAKKGPYSQSYGFSSNHVQMWKLDHKEGWMPKKWCFQTVVLEKILENPLDCKEIKPVSLWGKRKSLTRILLFVTLWTIQSKEFSRPVYWSG